MKLKNVHYEYRGNDIWRIYFKDYEEKEAFKNERTDGKKPACSIKVSGPVIRYYVDAKLTGQFSILRRCVKDPTNDRFSNDVWRALVKKIESADSDYTLDEIDLWYDATADKCYFRICCMNGTWTESFVKYMLNSRFGMIAQANGYYDTDTAYQGGLCPRRSCCGIGFDPSTYKTDKERIMFSVKDHCSNGKADIVKVDAWTNTFIGTNKEDEKEYSWSDFKKYMGLLHANGSDIWDIEWEYDAACPMTGTEVADKLHVYLQPGAYKRVFGEENKGNRIWLSTGTLWSNNDYLARVQALTPPPVPKWVKLDEDGKIGSATETAKLSGADFDGDTIEFIFNNKVMTLAEFNAFIKDSKATQKKEANNKEDNNMRQKDTKLADYFRRLYGGTITPVKPTKILIQGTATIIWWSDGTKTIVKCQKGDKMDPEKGVAMCVMKKFMGTNKTGSNYLDFAKPAIKDYEAKQKAMVAARKKAADKKRRAAKKEKEKDNGEV